ncbi:MAG TPA: YdeI/OmpD-associated family protein [Dermatophilaceae bacterium]|nr:YdeI/OmpD-associated family protein [Dermatophilaceae bacterium]
MADRPSDPIGTPGGTPERPALFFSGPAEFRRWLEAHHATATELWMGLYKKHVTEGRGLEWAQAVEEALCFGWIDSQAQRLDDDAVRQRWTPRKPGSSWSNINVEAVERLTAQGRMTPAGLAAYERRRADRMGIYAYEQDGELVLAPEYDAELAANPGAAAFFSRATPSYRKICVNWVMSAKQEATRRKRLAQLIDDSAHGRLIPTQRYGTAPAWVARLRQELGITD